MYICVSGYKYVCAHPTRKSLPVSLFDGEGGSCLFTSVASTAHLGLLLICTGDLE